MKNLVDRQLEAGKERRGHDLPSPVSDSRPESFGVSAVDRHHILIRIDEPVLIDSRATRTKIGAQVFSIASESDLLRLKMIARAARSAPGDAEDIAFLESRRKSST